MTQGIRDNEPDARVVYADIIDLPHWQSPTRKHMSLYDRAAQFSPFAALTGYDDMITEEARETGTRQEQDLELVNRKLERISAAITAGKHPDVILIVFVPDEKKDGGQYTEVSGNVKQVDAIRKEIVLFAGDGNPEETKIAIKNIHDIHGEMVDYLDDMVL